MEERKMMEYFENYFKMAKSVKEVKKLYKAVTYANIRQVNSPNIAKYDELCKMYEVAYDIAIKYVETLEKMEK